MNVSYEMRCNNRIIVLYCIVLYCIVLYCIVLYCIVFCLDLEVKELNKNRLINYFPPCAFYYLTCFGHWLCLGIAPFEFDRQFSDIIYM